VLLSLPAALPIYGLCVMLRLLVAVQLSVATTSPVRSGIWPLHRPSTLTFRLVGQVVITGALVSIAVMSAVQVVVLPAASVTVIVTVVVVPSATTVPATGLCVMLRLLVAVQLDRKSAA